MVEKIKDLKDDLLMQAEQDMHDSGQVDPKTIDGIKDLAEAEKACWEAEYYRSVTEAMEDGQMGYEDAMGYDGRSQGMRGQQGSQGYRRGYRRGYRGQQRDSMGRYSSRRGYRNGRYGHDDMMSEVREMMETADPKERERLKKQMRDMLGQM